ncbi:TlpA disulfide reductase family protein [Pedobacter aquatilis]|uniref:TlpA disulfide reductase family protein n=1 Tax=Pedobacter aquatilis TaxID=351343 RepID=UPI0025B537B0|nr:TlpA disulfide reductase family protein [Pedobacter aquatilis]MDN3586121.1 TlpA disulfide reductase family protein [Pedobacter aquatilis]
MKKLTINVVRALLCLIVKSFLICMFLTILLTLLLTASSSLAQQQQQQKVVSTRLNVGQQIPDELWNASLVSVSAETEKLISLQDYKGKAIIIDFWASWCSVCLKNMPLLDSIHSARKPQLQVLMMNASSSKIGFTKEKQFIRDFLTRHPEFSTPIVLRNDTLQIPFSLKTVPQYVWIGADGNIKAITSHEKLTDQNINKFLSGAELNMEEVNDDE